MPLPRAQDAPRPQVELVAAEPSRVGDPMSVRVTGLPPEREVVLFSELVDRYGRSWVGEATFRSTADGVVDPAKSAPTRAGWKGIDATGPFWSLARKTTTGAHPEPEGGNAERLVISAIVDGRAVATASRVRWHRLPDVTETRVTEGGLVARLFVAKGGDARPGIIVVTGSGGGINGAIRGAERFASHGYAAMALAYFGVPGLPRGLDRIPVEYFGRALDFMKKHPRVDAERIGIIGSSKGGELVLLVASRRKDVRAVVGLVPSSVVFQAVAANWPRNSSWSEGGAELPFVPYATSARFRQTRRLSYLYEDSLKNGDAVARATIPVERTQGAILLVTGRDDRVWPATAMCDEIMARLARKKFAFPCEHLAFDDAGHEVFAPGYRPVSWSPRVGGTAQGHAKSHAAAWPAVLAFFAKSLGQS